MQKILKAEDIRRILFLCGLYLLAISVPSSETGITVSLVIILVSWLFDINCLAKIKAFFNNKIALFFSLIYFVHLVWLFNTSNFDYAFFDLRTKFSILLFALVFSTSPMISSRDFRNILLVHSLTVVISTFIGVFRFYDQNLIDFRDFSPFISHVRFALNVCIAIFTFVYFGFLSNLWLRFSSSVNMVIKSLLALLIVWLIFFLTLMQSFTGLIIIFVIIIAGLLYKLYNSGISQKMKLGLFILLFAIPLFLMIFVIRAYNQYMTVPEVDFNKLERLTSMGNEYSHDTINFGIENGNWTGLYLCESEMKEAWNKKSSLKYDSLNKQGYYVSSTLIRYLNSKNLRKDMSGVNSLTSGDISNIENGISTTDELQGKGLKSRLNRIFFEIMQYKTKGEIKGSSMIQRWEMIKISLIIIRNNFMFGTGTGDVPDEFKKQLEISKSPLSDTRIRSHNQYLSLFVAYGIIGFLFSLLSLFYPYFISDAYKNYFVMVFMLIFFMSIFTEDTIESLSGATFYSFFGALYLFQRPKIA